MCHKLLQLYACGHTKDVCTTPCPHALGSAFSVEHTRRVSRAAYVNSPSLQHSDVYPSQRGPPAYPDSRPSSLPQTPVRPHTTAPPLRLNPPPAFRLIPPPSPRTPPDSAQSSPTSPTPTSSSTSSKSPEPKHCAYYFPRYLQQSRRPCVRCYMHPVYEGQRRKWMSWYAEQHPLEKWEDVERNCGVGRLREMVVEKKF